jgi:2-polyprenyl-3-methyl-5-hydroxy-6-metoxy-1,4-benzoquinol methylase
MKPADRILQQWRIRKILPYLKPNDRVLDIGSAQGVLFARAPWLAPNSVGIDPALTVKVEASRYLLLPGFFPQDMPPVKPFDVIVMLAVLEHFPQAQYPALAEGCARFLVRGGLLLITVPSPFVDTMLKWLKAFRVLDGMSLEEHHGYNVEQTLRIFANPAFELRHRETFQFGLNNLFVFCRL